ncbi:MAG: glycosyltransferase [Peptococcaceae bacterium]|nr:glycosyltransferase [Peptococcaceae bacterium]
MKGKKVVLAPRGEFSEGALALKNHKKRLYIQLARILKLYDNVKWHATTGYEGKDIKDIFGDKTTVDIATNLTVNSKGILYSKQVTKKQGELVLVYVSRIHPMKNLIQALELIKKLDGHITFNVFGPVEDKQYWKKCKKLIESMPTNIDVIYHGIIQNDKLYELYQTQHYFILLTFGENFGHAIAEALIGGCPVIISDRTPWRNLEEHQVGWDIPLKNQKQLIKILNEITAQNDTAYQMLSKNAYKFGKEKSINDKEINNYLNLFGT